MAILLILLHDIEYKYLLGYQREIDERMRSEGYGQCSVGSDKSISPYQYAALDVHFDEGEAAGFHVFMFPCFHVSMFSCFHVFMFPCFHVSMNSDVEPRYINRNDNL